MNVITITLSSPARVIHPIDGFIEEHEAVDREALLHINARADGTLALLYWLIGDRDEFEATLRTEESVATHELVALDDGFYAFVQVTADESGVEFIDVCHRHGLIIDTPLKAGEDGLQVPVVGPAERLSAVLKAIPEGIDFKTQNAGPYRPDMDELLSPLTTRQLETIRTAVNEGYYDIPRGATQPELADTLNCTASTVDEHLRKAEEQIVSGLIHCQS